MKSCRHRGTISPVRLDVVPQPDTIVFATLDQYPVEVLEAILKILKGQHGKTSDDR